MSDDPKQDETVVQYTHVNISYALMTAVGSIALVVAFIVWAFFMQSITVEPGEVAVLVDKPYFFGHKGVRDVALESGRALVFNTTSAIKVKVAPTLVTVVLGDLGTNDGQPISLESRVTMSITDAPALIKRYGADWLMSTLAPRHAMTVAAVVRKHGLNELLSPSGLASLSVEVEEVVRVNVAELNIPINIQAISIVRSQIKCVVTTPTK